MSNLETVMSGFYNSIDKLADVTSANIKSFSDYVPISGNVVMSGTLSGIDANFSENVYADKFIGDVSGTVNGCTVETSVPANAIFTTTSGVNIPSIKILPFVSGTNIDSNFFFSWDTLGIASMTLLQIINNGNIEYNLPTAWGTSGVTISGNISSQDVNNYNILYIGNFTSVTPDTPTVDITVNTISLSNYQWSYSKTSSDFVTCTLPHSINAEDSGTGSYYRGNVNYKLNLDLDSSKHYYLQLDSANQRGTVSVGDTFIASATISYNPQVFDITSGVISGTNTLNIALTNVSDSKTIPYAADFNFYNGLANNVKLIEVNKVCFDPITYGTRRCHIVSNTTTNIINVKSKVLNHDSENQTVNIEIKTYLNSSITAITTTSLSNQIVSANGSLDINENIEITSPQLWNGYGNGNTYKVEIKIVQNDTVIDTINEKTGFRSFTVAKYTTASDGAGFTLNGNAYSLYGVNFHCDKTGKANALTTADYDNDWELIEAIKPRMIKFAHYPCDHYLLDKCDSEGIVACLEIPWSRNFPASTNSIASEYRANINKAMDAMVNEYFNHPSIIFWCYDNELGYSSTLGYNTDELHTFCTTLYNRVKLADTQRLVCGGFYANTNGERGWADVCDVMFSTHYQGWYSNNVTNSLSDCNTDNAEMAMPKGINEYGYGANASSHVAWENASSARPTSPNASGSIHYEEYQCYCLEKYLSQLNTVQWPVCNLQWALFDFAVASRNEGGVPYTNTKGLISRDRNTIKDAYYLYKALWNSEKMVYICQKKWLNRETTNTNKIHVYSNCAKVELYVNGTLNQTLSASNGNLSVCWDFTAVDFVNGNNVFEVKGYTNVSDTTAIATDTFTYTYSMIAVTSITVSGDDPITDSGTLTATVLPIDATNQSVTWSSSNDTIATINTSTGLVTVLQNGSVIFTATSVSDPTISGTKTINCISSTVTSVTVSGDDTITNSGTLTATVLPEIATDKSVTWSSSSDTTATISSTGIITVLQNGSVTFTATSVSNPLISGTKVVNCVITADTVSISGGYAANNASYIIDTGTLSGEASVDGSTDTSVTWSSSDDSIATINSSTGTMNVVSDGTAIITATSVANTNVSLTKEFICRTGAAEENVDLTTPNAIVGSGSLSISGSPVQLYIIEANDSRVTCSTSGEVTVNAESATDNDDITYTLSRITSTDGTTTSAITKNVPTILTPHYYDLTNKVGYISNFPAANTGTTTLFADVIIEKRDSIAAYLISDQLYGGNITLTLARLNSLSGHMRIWCNNKRLYTTNTEEENGAFDTQISFGSSYSNSYGSIYINNVDCGFSSENSAEYGSNTVGALGFNIQYPAPLVGKTKNEITAMLDNGTITTKSGDLTLKIKRIVHFNNKYYTAEEFESHLDEATLYLVGTKDGRLINMNSDNQPVIAGATVTNITVIGDDTITNAGILTATVLPTDSTNPSVTWSSSNDTIATINSSTGLVTVLQEGSVTFTATSVSTPSVSGTKTISCVLGDVAVTGVTVSGDDTIINSGTLTANILPINANDKSVTWSSSNDTIATINSSTGEITVLQDGSVTFTATSVNNTLASGTKTINCVLFTGTMSISGGYLLNDTSYIISSGVLSGTAEIEGSSDTSVTWNSSDDSIATITSAGVMNVVSDGTAIISATSVANNRFYTTKEFICKTGIAESGIGINTPNAIVSTALLSLSGAPSQLYSIETTEPRVTIDTSGNTLVTAEATGATDDISYDLYRITNTDGTKELVSTQIIPTILEPQYYDLTNKVGYLPNDSLKLTASLTGSILIEAIIEKSGTSAVFLLSNAESNHKKKTLQLARLGSLSGNLKMYAGQELFVESTVESNNADDFVAKIGRTSASSDGGYTNVNIGNNPITFTVSADTNTTTSAADAIGFNFEYPMVIYGKTEEEIVALLNAGTIVPKSGTLTVKLKRLIYYPGVYYDESELTSHTQSAEIYIVGTRDGRLINVNGTDKIVIAQATT